MVLKNSSSLVERGLVRVATLALLMLAAVDIAQAASLRQGVAAFNRQDYVVAARIFTPHAEAGQPSAQAYLGFMYEAGRGVPHNYTEAAMWYRRAAEQGDSLARYSLGLLYDRGQRGAKCVGGGRSVPFCVAACGLERRGGHRRKKVLACIISLTMTKP